jgi:hypothetical protein
MRLADTADVRQMEDSGKLPGWVGREKNRVCDAVRHGDLEVLLGHG